MKHEKEVKAYFNSIKTEEKKQAKAKQNSIDEQEKVLIAAKLLSEKINKMSDDEYEKFINSIIYKLTIKKAKIADLDKAKEETEKSKKTKTELSEKQMNIIILGHVFAMGAIGTTIGVLSNLLLTDYEVHSAVLWGCGGAGLGIFTSYFHSIAADQHRLTNTLKNLKIKMLEKKQARIEKKVEHANDVLEELRTYGADGFKYLPESVVFADRVFNGVEEVQDKVYSKMYINKKEHPEEEEIEQ